MKRIGIGLIFIFLCATSAVYAQGVKKDAPIVRVSDLDTANVTCDELLRNTRLIAADRSWEVSRFTMTFKTADGKIYGPIHAEGAVLNEAQIKMIKKLKKVKAELTFDDINVTRDGKEKFTLPIVLRYNN